MFIGFVIVIITITLIIMDIVAVAFFFSPSLLLFGRALLRVRENTQYTYMEQKKKKERKDVM
jgi:predicted membrane protein